MKKRAFGMEMEYSVAAKCRDNSFATDFTVGENFFAASLFLRDALAERNAFSGALKELLWYSQSELASSEYFWLGSNGARFYFDSPERAAEYSTPECRDPREMLVHSMAGDTIVEDLRKEVLRRGLLGRRFDSAVQDIFIFRTITHFRANAKNRAVGCHENYTTLSDYDPNASDNKRFYRFRDFMAPFLVTRQILDGAGGVRYSPAMGWHYVVSQRAFFITQKGSADTVQDRGLFWLRLKGSEAPPGKMRLHLHCGDANMSHFGKLYAMWATHLVLRAWEEAERKNWPYSPHPQYTFLDFHALAADPKLKTKVRLMRGDDKVSFSAMEVQRLYAEFVNAYVDDMSEEEQRMFNAWVSVIDKLDKDPMLLVRELDWVIKRNYLREYHGGNLESEKAQFAATLYHDISERGIYNRLLRAGAVEQFASPEEIRACRLTPTPTRAEFRARYLKLLLEEPDEVRRGLDWGSYGSIDGTLNMPDPLERTTERGEELLAQFQKMISRRKKSGS